MSCQKPLYSWIEQVVTAFPQLSRPQAMVLAIYSFGAILAQRCGLNSVAAALAPLFDSGYSTIRSRLQEFYQPASAKSGNRRRQLLNYGNIRQQVLRQSMPRHQVSGSVVGNPHAPAFVFPYQ